MQIKSAKDLIVYQKAYVLGMEIFVVSKGFRRRKGTRLLIKSGFPFALYAQICGRRGRT
jgi:hypothetical protein